MELLGSLEKYFTQNPKKKLELCTYLQYGQLLSYLFPENLIISTISWDFNERFRCGHQYTEQHFQEQLQRGGYTKNLINFLRENVNCDERAKGCFANRFLSSVLNVRIHFISKALTYGKAKKKQYLSIFPRLRNLDAYRNLDQKTWKTIIDYLLETYPYKIVVHGAESEFMKFDNPRLVYPKSPLEQIKYFNESFVCITTTSGIAQFAANCACDVLILDKFYGLVQDFNPFNRIITMCNPKQLLETTLLEKVIHLSTVEESGTQFRESLKNRFWYNQMRYKVLVGNKLQKLMK